MTLDAEEYDRAEDDKAWKDDIDALRWVVAPVAAAWAELERAKRQAENDALDRMDNWFEQHPSSYRPNLNRGHG